jgi:uncharacterized C2H2 Zn-finger protein
MAIKMKTIESEESSEGLKCPHCDQVIKHHYSLDRHIKVVHEGHRPFICHCGKAFATREQFSRHTNSKHTLTKPFTCERGCQKAFSSYSARSYHHKIIHENLRYKCHWIGCYREYSSLFHLEKHLKKPHELLLQVIRKIQGLD